MSLSKSKCQYLISEDGIYQRIQKHIDETLDELLEGDTSDVDFFDRLNEAIKNYKEMNEGTEK